MSKRVCSSQCEWLKMLNFQALKCLLRTEAIAALSLVSSQPELTMNLLPFFESFYLRYGEDKRAIAS
ncbi:MAG: hypothetical protein RIM23_04010 [Coleofasciculus sp. G3-WIS-01]|uniref:hypothetical protein n=1 Tax=Coleofasciculus sp. G3-WIS-01 TaxID=3069528 RepID=UPI0032FA9110